MVYYNKMNKEVRAEFDRYVSYISKMDGVQNIYLFGSYAYGEPTESSDLDIYVVVRDDIDTLKLMQSISRGLHDRQYAIDVIADTDSDFRELSEPERVTLQREVRSKGVIVYGH